MERRSTILMLPAIVALCTHFAAARVPNVVIFYADDMGFGDLGCYGCTDIKTPSLDALARAGVRLTNYYSAAPVCSPSRAALVTGRYPQRAGVPGNVSSSPGDAGMPTDEVTLAELAKTRGYATAIVGKWHLGFSPDTQPNAQGFDFFFGHHAGCVDYYSHMFYWRAPHHHDLYRNRTEVHEEGAYMTELITREATRFIGEHLDEPFLLYVPYNAPHYPMQAPERFRKMYAHLPEPRRGYATLVAGLDESVGLIMNCLRDHGLTRDSLVFFMSDNGRGGSAGPFRSYKFSLFEGGIRMPAIVSWPGTLAQNETRDQLAIAMDVLPTLAKVIGAKLPDDRTIDGRSWMTFLKDAGAPENHPALFFERAGQHAVRQGKWKIVRNGLVPTGMSKRKKLKGEDAVFLADLEADPGETTNLHRQHPEMVKKLLAMHDAWRESIARDLRTRAKPQTE